MRAPRSLLRLRPPRLQVVLVGLALALSAMAAEAPPALGHAAFLESKPAPGQRLGRSPRRITLQFTEGLNRRLSRATVTNLRTGKQIGTQTLDGPGSDLVVRPETSLPTGPYRVDWFSVSADDGHPLQGSFSFGVRAAAVGGAHVVEQSPFARTGWLRIALRAVFYAALFFFAGGLLNAALLSRNEGPEGWLVPRGRLRALLEAAGEFPERRAASTWWRLIDAGWLAVAAAVAVALAEAIDAAGGLSVTGLNDYLLTNTAGLGRVITVVALVLAVLGVRRLPRLAALSCVAAFWGIALSGHANSADPRALAIFSDGVHLVAGAIWIGGIAQIAVTWTGPVLRGGIELRQAVMIGVLGRFGRVALPAFLVVVASGLTNALIELGHPQALWQTAYGRVLAVKMTLVGVIALFSYLHALRLRPRLVAANPHPDPGLERRHWRLLRSEPLVGVAVVGLAALLVAYPLPPRQASSAEGAALGAAAAPCRPSCPLPKLKPGQLAVADSAGSSIVAGWLRQGPASVSGQLRLFNTELQPPGETPTVRGAQLTACGPGCWSFSLRGHPRTIAVSVTEKGRHYTARLPARWKPGAGASSLARRLLARAQAAMNGLHSLREHERITSGPGSLAITDYRLVAPDRFAYRTQIGSETVTIGKHQWARNPGSQRWDRSRYGGAGPGFSTRSWFRWTPFADAVRLQGIRREHGQRIADVALYDPATPAWWRLSIDLGSRRVGASHLIAQGHYMTQRYYGFNRPVRIARPRASRGG